MDRKTLVTNFQIVQETLSYLLRAIHDIDVAHERNIYAVGLIQKADLQLLTIRRLYEQGQWLSELENDVHNYPIDPLSVATVLRGAYECMLTLNHVFVNPPNQEEVQLRFLFWALSTQISKEKGTAITEEGRAAFEEIRKNIESMVNYILDLGIVQPLDNNSKNLIRGKAKVEANDKWEYFINGTKLERAGGFHGLSERMQAREGVFTNLYKVFSLNAHPTWHSITIVVNAIERKDSEPDTFFMMDGMLSYTAMVGSLLIYDFCYLFEPAREAFKKLPQPVLDVVNELVNTIKEMHTQSSFQAAITK